jgi:Sulfotransferase domain
MSASRAVLLVRNPLDIIVSQFMMSATLTHSKSCSNDFVNEFAEEWQWLVKSQALLWNEFFKYWIELSRQKKIPVHVIRFEDLLTKKKESMIGTFEFLQGLESTEGLYIGKRINDVLDAESAGTHYKPRSGQANANLKYYSAEQLEYVKETCREYINFLGYSKTPGQENETGFFEYADLNEEELKQQAGFKAFN